MQLIGPSGLLLCLNSVVPMGVVQVGLFFPLEWTVLVVIVVGEYMSPAIGKGRCPSLTPRLVPMLWES